MISSRPIYWWFHVAKVVFGSISTISLVLIPKMSGFPQVLANLVHVAKVRFGSIRYHFSGSNTKNVWLSSGFGELPERVPKMLQIHLNSIKVPIIYFFNGKCQSRYCWRRRRNTNLLLFWINGALPSRKDPNK